MNYDQTIDPCVFALRSGFRDPSSFISELIPRSRAPIPDSFVPSADGIAIIDQDILRILHQDALMSVLAHRRPRPRFPGGVGWIGPDLGTRFMSSPTPGCLLSIQRYGKLWAVEREQQQKEREVLCFAHGPLPIFRRKHRVAMSIAHYSHPALPEDADFLQWVPISS